MQYLQIPKKCPICGGDTEIIVNESGVKNLFCTNSHCNGKIINKLDHFCGKKGLDIKGLSKATLEKLIDWGWINSFRDILRLRDHKEEWVNKSGFGVASVTKILVNIELATHSTLLWRVIAAAGIPQIGLTASKALAKKFNTYAAFRKAIEDNFDFTTLADFGEVANHALLNFDYTEIDEAVSYGIEIKDAKELSENNQNVLQDLKFAITGKLKLFKNRDELKTKIESLGGKVVSSISKNTNYLINNDIDSQSSKNLTAKKMSIPIITEEQFLDWINNS